MQPLTLRKKRFKHMDDLLLVRINTHKLLSQLQNEKVLFAPCTLECQADCSSSINGCEDLLRG